MNEAEIKGVVRQYRDIAGVVEIRALVRAYVVRWTEVAIKYPEKYPEYRGRVLAMKQLLKDIES